MKRGFLVAAAMLVTGCGDGKVGTDPGALIEVEVKSKVGLLLDDLPAELRERAAASALAKPPQFWIERANLQLQATRLRLAFRRYYSILFGDLKGQLQLPPDDKRTITLDPAGAKRETLDGHDLVTVGYTLAGALVTGLDAPLDAEPELATVGGKWEEAITFPIDPDLLLQRTGFACSHASVDEPNAIDAENLLHFYDDLCDPANSAGPQACAQIGPQATETCKQALAAHVGHVDVKLRYSRVPWNEEKAKQARTPPAKSKTADMAVRKVGLEQNRLIYRYIPADSCTVFEGCVGAPGWRRLLQYDASVENVGEKELRVGAVASSSFFDHNVYEYSSCHMHFHFRFYGDFSYGDSIGGKRAFCLISSRRYANNETSPLTAPFDNCQFQGISPGWGDDYFAGLECQWLDVTDAPRETPLALRFAFNTERFLCEGTPMVDLDGKQRFETTGYFSEKGDPIDRPMCDFAAGWDANNLQSATVTVPEKGGMVTSPCTRGQLGPRRDCGFTEIVTPTCTSDLTLRCTIPDGAKPQQVRACEYSAALRSAIACGYVDSLANAVVQAGAPVTLAVGCPAARDAYEPGGRYSLFASPVFDGDEAAPVTCVAQ